MIDQQQSVRHSFELAKVLGHCIGDGTFQSCQFHDVLQKTINLFADLIWADHRAIVGPIQL